MSKNRFANGTMWERILEITKPMVCRHTSRKAIRPQAESILLDAELQVVGIVERAMQCHLTNYGDLVDIDQVTLEEIEGAYFGLGSDPEEITATTVHVFRELFLILSELVGRADLMPPIVDLDSAIEDFEEGEST